MRALTGTAQDWHRRLHAVKGGRADLTVLPPLVVHADEDAAISDEVNAMVG
ncbi:hypothetical protein [Corallococcus exiguus]|uniref:hypothetical protein n=1 Tax=Corallococcus exiguus TaxID=83462 RepID=UPI0013150E3F|nr:hypothetical protein [Corallococcus exiguus]NRD44312.1 hypothetical protein [Corallococcus exiguus]